MLYLIVSILVPLLILALILWVCAQLGMDAKTLNIVRVIAVVLIVIWLLAYFFGAVPGYTGTPMGAHPMGRCL